MGAALLKKAGSRDFIAHDQEAHYSIGLTSIFAVPLSFPVKPGQACTRISIGFDWSALFLPWRSSVSVIATLGLEIE
jgi:hypothetical protein